MFSVLQAFTHLGFAHLGEALHPEIQKIQSDPQSSAASSTAMATIPAHRSLPKREADAFKTVVVRSMITSSGLLQPGSSAYIYLLYAADLGYNVAVSLSVSEAHTLRTKIAGSLSPAVG